MTRTDRTFTFSLMELVIGFGLVGGVLAFEALGWSGFPLSDALWISVLFGVGTAGIAYSELR